MGDVNPDHQAPLVNVAMWILLVSCGMVVTGKLITKWVTTKYLQCDDYMAVASLLAGVAFSVAVTEQTKAGLGMDISQLDEDKIQKFFKALYASDLLYIVTLASSKLITLLFYRNISASNTGRKIVWISLYVLPVWTVISCIVALVPCAPPRPWDSRRGQCISFSAFWGFTLVFDVVSQIAISVLPIYLLNALSLRNTRTKWVAMLGFSPNIITVPLAIMRYIYLQQGLTDSNFTYAFYNSTLLSAIHALLAIVAAGIPFTKPILDSIIHEAHIIVNDGDAFAAAGYIHGSKSGAIFAIKSNKRSLQSKQRASAAIFDSFQGQDPHQSDGFQRWSVAIESKRPMEGEAELGTITAPKKARVTTTEIVDETRIQDERSGSQEAMVIRKTVTMELSSHKA